MHSNTVKKASLQLHNNNWFLKQLFTTIKMFINNKLENWNLKNNLYVLLWIS